jgi:hypothetical protein
LSGEIGRREWWWQIANVRFGSKADIWVSVGDVRFTRESGHY